MARQGQQRAKEYQAAAQLPLRVRNLVTEAERDLDTSRRESLSHGKFPALAEHSAPVESVFSPLAIEIMNVREVAEFGQMDDKAHRAAAARIGQLRAAAVQTMAAALSPGVLPTDAIPPHLQAEAERRVDGFMEKVYDVPLRDKGK
ncbi:MAG: hypothetical protein K2Q01_02980 [Rickettsiales bacterium]|nr:hypothetical protein [Rickettsiales bacterium]